VIILAVCTLLLLLQVQRLRLRLRMEESARAMLQRSRLAQQLQQQNRADDQNLHEDEHDGYSAPAHGQEVCIYVYLDFMCVLSVQLPVCMSQRHQLHNCGVSTLCRCLQRIHTLTCAVSVHSSTSHFSC
jgi:hypothetical protein